MRRSLVLLTVATAAAPVVWGTTYAVTTELLPPDRPLQAGALRALPAGLLLVAVTRRLPTGSWWWRSAALGTLNIGAFFALLFVSAYRLPGGVAAVLGAAGPLLVACLSVPVLGQRLTARAVLAGLAAAAGVALTVLTAQARLDTVGVAAGLGGAASMAFGVVLTKRWGRPAPLLTVTGWQLAAGGLVLLPFALVLEGVPATLTGRNLGGHAYLALVGGAVAYSLWFRGLERLPAASVSLLGQLSPVVAAAVGWAVLGQHLTALQVVGMAVALGAVVAGQAPAPGAGSPAVARQQPASAGVPGQVPAPPDESERARHLRPVARKRLRGRPRRSTLLAGVHQESLRRLRPPGASPQLPVTARVGRERCDVLAPKGDT